MPFTQTITRPKLQTAVLKWIAAEDFCFEQETALANCAASQAVPGLLDIGTVLGEITVGNVTVNAPVAGGSNAGNGTAVLGGPLSDGAVQAGVYEAVAVSALEWEVFDPAGKLIGVAADAVAFTTQVHFTITHSTTPFAVGDKWTISVTIAAGSGKVVPLNPSATDGSQNAMGVLIKATTVPSSADVPVVVVERQAVLLADGLIWPSGISAQAQATALTQLLAKGLIVRSS